MACTKNPIIEYIDYILTIHAEDPSVKIQQNMEDDPYFMIGTSDEYCCSDCSDLYYIGPLEDALGDDILYIIYTLLGLDFPLGCCENYNRNLNTGKFVEQSTTRYKSIICCNSFNACANAFNNIIQETLFLDSIYLNGIQEYGAFNNDSILCTINAKIQTLDIITKQQFLEAFLNLGGFVTTCDGVNVYVGTSAGFRNYY